MEVREHDDTQWVLNAASAELQCLQAENLYELGKSEKALDVMGKVAPSNSGDISEQIADNLTQSTK